MKVMKTIKFLMSLALALVCSLAGIVVNLNMQ